jgi:predicted Holliday junction resolvase-like endonuclease
MPRFRLRSLVVLIVFLAMALTIGQQSIRIQRLRVERDRAQLEARVQRDRAEDERLRAMKATYSAYMAELKAASDRALKTRRDNSK